MTEVVARREGVLDGDRALLHSGAAPGPVWFYRFNPFRREPLHDEQLVELLDRLVAADHCVARSAEQASDDLHGLVGAEQDDAERKRLIALRRAVRKGTRLPAGAVPASVTRWRRIVADRAALVDRIVAEYDAAARRERQRLARLLQDPALVRSLPLVAPEVGREAERYAREVGNDGEARARTLKSERGLLQYLARASMRTSPLSQLTAVGLTEDALGGSSPDCPRVRNARSFLGLDRVMLDYVIGGAEARAGLHADAWLSLPPTSAVDDGRFYFLQPHEQGYTRSGVRLTGPIAVLVSFLAMGPVRRDRLVQGLLPELGEDRGRIEALLTKCCLAGMLCTVLPSTDADLTDLGPRGVPDLDPALADVRADLDRLADEECDRPQVLSSLADRLGSLSRGSGRPAKVAVTEDRLVDLEPVDARAWAAPLDDLGVAVELLHVFDWLADVELALTDAFVAEHGAGAVVPLMPAAGPLVERVSRAAAEMTAFYARPAGELPTVFGGEDSPLARLFRLRRRVEAMVWSALSRAVASGDSEVALDRRELNRLLNGLPARVRQRPIGYGVLVQRWRTRLVLNDGLPGHGMLYSRFLGMDRAAGGDALGRLRDRLLHQYAEPGVRLVEDRSHQGMNVNVHPPVLPDVLEPADWHRLLLRHDPATEKLTVLDGNQPIKVLPIGGGHPGLYPPALSVASGLVIAGRLFNGLPDAWAAADGRDPAATREVPRTLVGDVVIGRRRWYPGTDFYEALSEHGERLRLLAVTRWRERHGVPNEVMVKSVPADTGPASVSSPDAQEARFRSKPQYVDLSSVVAVRVLPRMLERRSSDQPARIYLEEATPGMGAGPHAEEWVVEIDRPAGGRFGYGAVR